MGCPLPTVHGLVPRSDKMFHTSPCSTNLRFCDLYCHSHHKSSLCAQGQLYLYLNPNFMTQMYRCTNKFMVVVQFTLQIMLCRYKLYLSHWMMMRKMKLQHIALMTVMVKNVSCLLKRRYEKILMLTQVSYPTEREKMRKTNFGRNSDKCVIYSLKSGVSRPVNANHHHLGCVNC